MANEEALLLARIQFGFTISFHIIFPAITIGLASYLAVLEAFWLKTGRAVFRDLYQFWLKVFAVNFGMGVVSGLVMSYQFGTNWSYFSDFAGSVTGPLLAYEVLTAFFLEAGFLGVMLFGVEPRGAGTALLRDADGRGRHAHLGDVDPRVEQLDAHAGRVRVTSSGLDGREPQHRRGRVVVRRRDRRRARRGDDEPAHEQVVDLVAEEPRAPVLGERDLDEAEPLRGPLDGGAARLRPRVEVAAEQDRAVVRRQDVGEPSSCSSYVSSDSEKLIEWTLATASVRACRRSAAR